MNIYIYVYVYIYIYIHCSTAPSGAGPPHCRGFMIKLMLNTLGRTPLEVIGPSQRPLPDNARARAHTHTHTDTHKHTHTHKGQTSIKPARFEPTIPASERPQTLTLDRAATGIGAVLHTNHN
jgi:hypothetical protein